MFRLCSHPCRRCLLLTILITWLNAMLRLRKSKKLWVCHHGNIHMLLFGTLKIWSEYQENWILHGRKTIFIQFLTGTIFKWYMICSSHYLCESLWKWLFRTLLPSMTEHLRFWIRLMTSEISAFFSFGVKKNGVTSNINQNWLKKYPCVG